MPAYVISGHGCDINTKTHLVKKTVPPGCVYVTYEECGMISWGEIMKAFSTLEDPTKYQYMNDPIRYENELKHHFGDSLHVHKPGETYVDAQYDLALDFKLANGITGIIKSGVFEIGAPFHPIDINAPPGLERYASPTQNNMITHAMIDAIYKDSIFPTADQMKSLLNDPISLDDLKTEMTRHGISQSRLFSLKPAIYYNFICRSLCLETGRNIAANERERGNRMTNLTGTVATQLNRGPRNISEFVRWFGQRYPPHNVAMSPSKKRQKVRHAVEHIPIPPTFAIGVNPRSNRPGYTRKANLHKKLGRKTRRRSPNEMSL